MARALVEIVGDAESYIRALRKSAAATDQMSQTLKGLKTNAEGTARAEVDAIVRKQARQRQEIVLYKEIAATAVKGSREQIAAANLAAQAESRLSRSLGISAAESRRFAASSASVERDFGRLGRGAVAGSLGFNRLGRTISYASGYLLASGGLVFGLRTATNAAVEHQEAEAQLQAAVEHAGVSFQKYSGQIDETLHSQRNLSGFSENDTVTSFTKLLRTTKDVGQALRYNQLAMEIARGANIDLNTAANVVNKTLAGQTTGLRRLGVELPKGVSGYRALQIAGAKYAGSIAAYAGTAAGAQARLSNAIHETEVTIGTALLPTITKYSTELADWLGKSQNQARVQRDVTTAVRDFSTVLQATVSVVQTMAHAVGGLKNLIEGLIVLKLASVLTSWSLGFAATGTAAAGANAKLATTEARLAGLRAASVAPIIFTVEVIGLEAIASKIKALQKGYLSAQAHVNTDTNRSTAAQVKNLAALVTKEKKAGYTDNEIIQQLRGMLGGNTDAANAVIANVLNYAGGGPEKKKVDAILNPKTGATGGAGGGGGAGAPAASLDRLSQIQNQVAAARLAVAQGQSGAGAQLVAALRAEIAFDEKYAAIQKRLYEKGGKNAKQHADAYQRLIADESSAFSEIDSMTKKAAADNSKKSKAANTANLKAWADRLKELRARVVAAGATSGKTDDIAALQAEIAAIRARIREVGKSGALELALAHAQKQLATARKKKTASSTFTEPYKLLLAEAKANAEGTQTQQRNAELAIKKWIEAQIKQHKLVGQALIDAYNQIASINSSLGTGTAAKGAAVSTRHLTEGLGLTKAQRLALESRYAQTEAHGGTYAKGEVGALGQAVNIYGDVVMNGVEDAAKFTKELQKHGRRGAASTRGQRPGVYQGLH